MFPILLQVDVVYIGSIHVQHKQSVVSMFDAGKPVLCEKPLTTSKADNAALIQAAREKGMFLMEVDLTVIVNRGHIKTTRCRQCGCATSQPYGRCRNR